MRTTPFGLHVLLPGALSVVTSKEQQVAPELE